MCGATGAPTMDPWFRRFELEQSQERTHGHADPRDQIQRETRNSHQPIIIGREAPKFLKSLSGNLGISGPQRGPNLDAGRCLLADAAASLKISISDEWNDQTEAPFVVL